MNRKVLLVLILVLVTAAAWTWRKPISLVALTALGRGGICSLSQVLDAPANWKPGAQALSRVKSQSRIVRSDDKFDLWETPYGPFWVPKGSPFLPFNIAEQERDFYGHGRHAVQEGDVVLDCGANVGVFTRRALAKGAKTVIAIEPAPENLECLRRNVDKEIEAGSVVIVPKGVWDSEGFLSFYVDKRSSAADRFVVSPKQEEKAGLLQLPITTIDKLVAELGLDRVDFIKMDIEGAERNALAGAVAVLNEHKPRLSICTYHRDDDPATIPALVLNAAPGYGVACGPCAVEKMKLRPHALYFSAGG